MDNTRENLIELLKESGVAFPISTANFLVANGVTLDNQVSSSKWIPVTERVPEDDQVVLCYKFDRGIRIGKHLNATYADGVSAFMDCGRNFAFGATHWMPLPEPPEED